MDEVAHLRAELAARDAMLAARDAMIAKLLEQMAKLTDRVAELVAAVERKKRKPAPAAKPTAPVTLDEDTRKRFEERPLPPEKPKAKRGPSAKA